MRLVKLTELWTESNVYVDFDKVTDIIECGSGTILRCGEQSITVKESRKQIDELEKQEKGDLNVDYNFFDYVDNETIHIKNFVMATSLIRKSDTWASENKIYQICGVVNECNEIFLMFDDLDELIEASREIYARKNEVLCDNIFIAVINVEMVANSVDEFLEKIKQAEEI